MLNRGFSRPVLIIWVHMIRNNPGMPGPAGAYACREQGSWSNYDCLLTVVQCGGLGDPPNGEVSLDGVGFRSQAIYNCSAGYNLFGDMTRSCEADGRWSGSQPACEGDILFIWHFFTADFQWRSCNFVFRPSTVCIAMKHELRISLKATNVSTVDSQCNNNSCIPQYYLKFFMAP